MLDQLLRQHLDQIGAVGVARLHDLHQRRPAERFDAEEAAAEGGARLAFELAPDRRPRRRRRRTPPIRRARPTGSKTNVSEGSSLMVRSSFMRAGLCCAGSYQDGLAEARQQRLALDVAARPCGAAADRRCRRCRGAGPFSRGKYVEIALGHRAEAALLPGVERDHEIAREAFHHVARTASSAKPSSSSAVICGLAPGSAAGHRGGADHGAEHQPGRHLVLAHALRPGQPSAAHQPAD